APRRPRGRHRSRDRRAARPWRGARSPTQGLVRDGRPVAAMTTANKVRKRPKQRAERFPATGTKRDAPHTSRAMRGRPCVCCEAHRWLARLDARDLALAKRYEDAPMIEGSVQFGANATDELREQLNGGQDT